MIVLYFQEDKNLIKHSLVFHFSIKTEIAIFNIFYCTILKTTKQKPTQYYRHNFGIT